MDLATVIGFVFGIVVIIGTIQHEGNIGLFINIPAFAIVFGGMTAATMIHFSMGQFLGIFSVIKKTLLHKAVPPQELIRRMVNYAAINRLIKGLQMLIDGQNEEAIKELMEMEVQYLEERHAMGKKILDFMGASCPSFAMVGTLIGLVSMLSKMENPDQVGKGMAVALVCTFWGALSANLIFLPLGGKLGQHSKTEKLSMEMTMAGVCAIAKGESPTAVREKMQIFISAKRREEVKAKG